MLDDRFFRGRIVRRVDFAPDLWMIRMQLEGSFAFQPGQYATLAVEADGKRLERPYSIVSCPREAELEFFFELVPAGVLTPRLYQLGEGAELYMRKSAKGRFTLNLSSERTKHLLVSTVTGVAPYVSAIRALAADWKEGRFAGNHHLHLIHGASRSWELGYHEELQHFSQEVPWLRYTPTISRPWEDAAWQGETGRVDDILRKCADCWGLSAKNSLAYLCGHPDMIEHAKGILKRAGFEREHLKEEIYWIPGKQAEPA